MIQKDGILFFSLSFYDPWLRKERASLRMLRSNTKIPKFETMYKKKPTVKRKPKKKKRNRNTGEGTPFCEGAEGSTNLAEDYKERLLSSTGDGPRCPSEGIVEEVGPCCR